MAPGSWVPPPPGPHQEGPDVLPAAAEEAPPGRWFSSVLAGYEGGQLQVLFWRRSNIIFISGDEDDDDEEDDKVVIMMMPVRGMKMMM